MTHTHRFVAQAALASAALLGGLLAASPPAAADTGAYYVSSTKGSDSNDGRSPGSPFKTIQQAADRTLPGDTVFVMNGTYGDVSSEGVVQITRSGTAGKPITYRPYPGQHPVIAPVTGWNGVLVAGASYITVTGLDVRGPSDRYTLAEAEAGSVPGKAKFNTNCIDLRADKTSGRTPHHVVVSGNHVWDCPGGGIASTGADHLLIEHNTVHSNAWYSVYANSGISVLTPVDVDSDTGYKIIIRDNLVYGNETKVKWSACDCYSDGNGIIVDSTLTGEGTEGKPYAGRSLVENNVSYDNGGSGIHAYKSSHVDIVHNTAYLNSQGREIAYPNIGAWNSEDVNVLDNISVASPGKPTNFIQGNTDVVYDYNVYWGGTTPQVQGPHDLVADPRLTAPGTEPEKADFRPTASSVAVDSGVPTRTRTDFAGVPRPQGAGWDRGAYEYVPSRHADRP
ncbi:right-handed parallel beta-helix repeat-containing protein [Streptomyces sp. NPDC049954]|uniref:right-handed parallel beta-helix repeat-containing protein n=1 Tax=Streptomyces sp. NPDC049954 TaxID=3155779 RepID=UPI003449B926